MTKIILNLFIGIFITIICCICTSFVVNKQQCKYKKAIEIIETYAESNADISTISDFYNTKEGEEYLNLIY